MNYILSMDMRHPTADRRDSIVDIRNGYNIIIQLFCCNPLVFSNLRLLRVHDKIAILKESSKSVNYSRRSNHFEKGDGSMPVSSVARR
jgi:hypothetical protein